ncbi:MAG: peptidylprolyl isomerase [Paludibacteraceae bacterium]|nr:peptidylprolyl isomerase [Paludibacteraceae bacterium]
MKQNILTVLLFAAATVFAAEDKVLLTIDGEPIMESEFEYIYEKNNSATTIEKKTKDEYLDLFINFKLKVKEAEAQGIDTTAAFKKELKGYRAQATPKYMRDDAAVDSLVEMSYNRMANDRRAAHIVVACPMDAGDSANQAALEKINTLRERVTVGLPVKKGKGRKAKITRTPEDFYAVAIEASEDPDIANNKGELGWIIPFRYVYPFEDAVYRTPVGQVSEVFRTPFGYHIALVEEERPNSEVHAAHIMKMVPRDQPQTEETAKAAIDSIYALLKDGADFAKTAQELSDDKGSAMRGGDLGWFRRGMMVRSFENVAFGLNGENALSEPFRSEYGWHIVLKYGERGIQPLDSLREQIKTNVQRDERMKEADKSFVRKARAEYNLPAEMTDAEVKEYADAHLEDKYPDLKNLVREYHDGILLFEVSLKEVWDKASQDKEGLQRYFNEHRSEYTWDKPKYKGYFVQCKTKAAARAAKSIIKNCMYNEPDSIASLLDKRLNLDSVTYVKYKHGLWEQGQNKAIDKYAFGDKKSEFAPSEELPYVFVVGKKLKNPEDYTDERAKVTTAYQDELEKKWVEELRRKHTVVIK